MQMSIDGAEITKDEVLFLAQNGNADAIEGLWWSVPVRERLKLSNKILMEGVRNGKFNVVEWVLDSRQDLEVNKAMANGMTLLHLAAGSGQRELMSKLIERGADIEAKCEKGNTPLHYAILIDALYEGKLHELVMSENNVMTRNKDGKTPDEMGMEVQRIAKMRKPSPLVSQLRDLRVALDERDEFERQAKGASHRQKRKL